MEFLKLLTLEQAEQLHPGCTTEFFDRYDAFWPKAKVQSMEQLLDTARFFLVRRGMKKEVVATLSDKPVYELDDSDVVGYTSDNGWWR